MTQTASEAAVGAAIEKMNEGLQDYLNAIADAGEPEVPVGAVMLFEARGMAEGGQFERTSYVWVEPGPRTSMLGMLEIAGEKAHHALACAAEHDG